MTRLHWSLFLRTFYILLGTLVFVVIGLALAKPILLENVKDFTIREKYILCAFSVGVLFLVNYLSILRIQIAGEEDVLFNVSLSVSNYVGSYLALVTARSVAVVVSGIAAGFLFFQVYELDLQAVNAADLVTLSLWLFFVNTILFLQNKHRNSDTDSIDFKSRSARSLIHLAVGLVTLKACLVMPLAGLMMFSIYFTFLLYFGRSILFRYFPAHLQRNIGVSLVGFLLVVGIFNLMILFQSHRESLLIWGQR